MSDLRIRALRVVFALLVSTTVACVSSIRQYQPLTQEWEASRLDQLEVEVSGQWPNQVEHVTALLNRAGVFRRVVAAGDEAADLLVTVKESSQGIRCSTPQMLTLYTLGLFTTSNGYVNAVTLEFRGKDSPAVVTLEERFVAHTTHGLCALLLRASGRWSRLKGTDPANFAKALRAALVSRQSEILSLTQPNNIRNPTSGGRRPPASPRRGVSLLSQARRRYTGRGPKESEDAGETGS
jgi:hypothetical protein